MSTNHDTPTQDPKQRAKSLADTALETLMAAFDRGESDAMKRYLSVMSRFHNYSFGNVLLIGAQRPNATHVAGFHKWLELNRHVRKGEKGIAILAPLVRKIKVEDEAGDDARQVFGFRAVYVFDVEQTDGEPLPEFETVHGDPSDRTARLKTFVASQHIELLYDVSISPARGMSSGGTITLLPDLTPAEEFAVLTHELAHEMLHRDERRKQTNPRIRETEAEAVAFVVSSSIGLDTGTSFSDYIQLYKGDRETLSQSLSFVQQTAHKILEALDAEVSDAA